MSDQTMEFNDAAFEEMMQQKLNDEFSADGTDMSGQVTDERLREMNKKLPSWNLEPPYTFLK